MPHPHRASAHHHRPAAKDRRAASLPPRPRRNGHLPSPTFVVSGPNLSDPPPRLIVPRRPIVDPPPTTSDAAPNPAVVAVTGVDAGSGPVDAPGNHAAHLEGDVVPGSTGIAGPATVTVGPVDPVVRPANRVVATVTSVDRPWMAVVPPIGRVDRPSMCVDAPFAGNVGDVNPADRCHRERTPVPRSIASTFESAVASISRVDAAIRLVAQRVRRVDLPTGLVVHRANHDAGANFASDPLVDASELG